MKGDERTGDSLVRDAKVPTRERFFERGGSNEGIVPCLEVSKVDEDRAVSIEGDERTSLVVEDVKSFGVELGGSKERREVVRSRIDSRRGNI